MQIKYISSCVHIIMHVHNVVVFEGGVRSKKPVYIGVKALNEPCVQIQMWLDERLQRKVVILVMAFGNRHLRYERLAQGTVR